MPTLLLADDSITVQRVIALTFANEQIRVVAVSDGTQAVERMKTLHPDIVLAGTVLPQVNGYDLAKHMRTIPGLKNVPVLLLTGAFETVDEEKLKASGANGVLEKPVEPISVIARVKELLGLKSEPKPVSMGRLVTSAEGPPPVATPARAVTSTIGAPFEAELASEQTGLRAGAHPDGDAPTRSDDYLDTLDAAFDTLDRRLSGRVSGENPSRNPSGPLGQSSGAPDPRSPGRGPEGGASTPAPGHPVFEVDEDWFGGDDSAGLADAREGRRETKEHLKDPELQGARPAPAPAAAVFEVDDTWFAEADKARAAKLAEHRAMAVDMGVHDVDVPHTGAVTPAPPAPLGFEFGSDHIKKSQDAAPASADAPSAAHAPQALHAPQAPARSGPSVISAANTPAAAPVSDARASSPGRADDFPQLLGSEQGQPSAVGRGPGPPAQSIAPEVTEAMLEQVVARVAERLSTGGFGEQLMNAVTASVRDTVREIASATSERLVREIASEASERLSREIALETSERVGREIALQTSERLSRQIAVETSERHSREIASEASERVSREIATEASERVSREIAIETSERLSREIVTATSERVSREIASATSERLVREIASETSERLARDIVSETSERLVRDEIERIKSKARS